jgi:hypothetical protein
MVLVLFQLSRLLYTDKWEEGYCQGRSGYENDLARSTGYNHRCSKILVSTLDSFQRKVLAPHGAVLPTPQKVGQKESAFESEMSTK